MLHEAPTELVPDQVPYHSDAPINKATPITPLSVGDNPCRGKEQ